MIAVLDACVIYPPALRDVLMWLAVVVAYEPRWTEEIHAEWMRNVLEDRPDVTPEQLERTRRLMDQVSPKCLVSGYETRIPSLQLPDVNDRHVLAAAIEAGATVIVTFNLSDFPRAALEPYGIRALAPDPFLEMLYKQNSPRFLQGLQRHRTSLKNPSKTTDEYIDALISQGLKRTGHLLQAHKAEI
ncbi:MAG TPA: PIN domain-containing protein [Chthonomonadaceae bacterium]|nr:PIN domain-containing protein [Chthonomonadaceae bacterium]